MSRSSTARRDYLKSRRRQIEELSQEAREIEREEMELLFTDDSVAVRDKDGVWRPADQLKYTYNEEDTD